MAQRVLCLSMGLTSSLRAVASPAHPLGVSGVLGAGLSPVSAQPGPPWALGAAGGLELAMSPPRLHCLLSYVELTTPPAQGGTEVLSFKCFSQGPAYTQCFGKRCYGCVGKSSLESRLVVPSPAPACCLACRKPLGNAWAGRGNKAPV